MPVKLHTCSLTWIKLPAHPCTRVQKALEDEGIEYELVKGSLRDRSEIRELSGQSKYPAIEFEESKDMAARIRAGKLFDEAGDASTRT